MVERGQPVVEPALGAGARQRSGDVDDMDVLEGLDEFGQFEIGLAIAIAMPLRAPFGHAERLHGRLGQVVDQDRRRRARAQGADQAPRLGDIVARRILARRRRRDRAARAQGADQDGVGLALLDPANVVGKRGADANVQPAGLAFARQKLGLALQVAIGEQSDVHAPPARGDIDILRVEAAAQ